MLLGEYAAICQRLSDEYSESVVNVWPARQHIKSEDRLSDDVTLVVMTKEADFSMSEYEHHKVHVCCIHNTEPESQANMTQDVFLSTNDDDKIGSIIFEKAACLFREHSNITMIKPSAVKITDGKPTLWPCICICCKVKGMVPLGEELFPKKLEGIDVDVVIGSVILCMDHGSTPNHTDVRQQNLKVSSSISPKGGEFLGTIGGFCFELNDEQKKVGLITAYHNLICNEKLPKEGDIIIQPGDNNRNDYDCGTFKDHRLENISFNSRKYFADVAFCEINTDCAPVDNSFPEEMTRNGLPIACSLNEATVDDIVVGAEAYKVGQSTLYTTGKISTLHAVLPKSLYGTEVMTDCEKYLPRVFEIVPNKKRNEYFGEDGDSGSLVFDIRDDKPNILGMVIMFCSGGVYRGCAYACQIKPVLEAMHLKLKTF